MKKDLTKYELYLRGIKRKNSIVNITQIGILVIFLCVWEIGAITKIIDPFFFSSPSRIVNMLYTLATKNDLFKHIGVTLLECVLGFVIATVLGTVIASVLWWSEFLRRVFEPYIIVLNSLPKVALGPLIIIWVGVGMQTIVIMAVLIAVIITIISVLSSFISCDAEKILLLKSMGATKTQIFLKLVFPRSLTDLISVLKINVGLSWVGTVMGEYISSKAGLGYLILYGSIIFQNDLVIASTVVLCILAASMYLLVSLLERLVKKRR